MNELQLKTMVNSYIETALWSSVGDIGEYLSDIDNITISDGFIKESIDDCKSFVDKCGSLLDNYPSTIEQLGHDFWLTRCRHGAGFWDRCLGKTGDKLTEIAESFTHLTLYVGDDDLVYSV